MMLEYKASETSRDFVFVFVFIVVVSFQIPVTNTISGNAFDAKRRKRGWQANSEKVLSDQEDIRN